MAIAYEILRLREGTGYSSSASNSGGKQTVKQEITQCYLVKAYDDLGADLLPEQVTDSMAGLADGLPKVNQTIYYDPVADIVGYGSICTSKKVKRTKENGLVFKVDVVWSNAGTAGVSGSGGPKESDDQQGPPVASINDLPTTVTPQITEREIVLYQDLTTEANGGPLNTRLIPGTREPFAAPVTMSQSQLTLTVTQYETSISFQAMMDRSYKVNSDAWNSKGPRRWRIGAVSATEVEVQLQSGPATVAKVVYPITLDEYEVIDPLAVAPNNTEFVGHDTALPLIGTRYFDQNVKLRKFADVNTAYGQVGLLSGSTSGYPLGGFDGSGLPDPAIQGGSPKYKVFQSNEAISFDFLKYGNP